MRTTKTFQLPVTKKEVVAYSYITGGEKRILTETILKGGSVDFASQQMKGEITMDVLLKANDKAVELLVQSVGGATENIIEVVKELPAKDFDFLYSEINKISGDTDFLEEGQI